jgi:glucose-6-phosphate-specific signal transduction histidine kinase
LSHSAKAGANGSGLVGLADRVAALGGQLTISSQPGRGTSLAAKIPLERLNDTPGSLRILHAISQRV